MSSDPIAHPSIHAAFEETAGRFPERPAVEMVDGQSITYAGLNAAANRLAWRLLDGHGKKGDRVAILLSQDALMFASLIGVLKAGRVAVVLSALDPAARHVELVRDAEPTVIITDATHKDLATAASRDGAAVVYVDGDLAGFSDGNPPGSIAPDDVAILTYTSGTTGRPKGVMQTHRLYLHNSRSSASTMALTPDDRVLLVASLSGAQGQSTAWAVWTSGASLMSFPAVVSGVTGLAGWMRDRRVTIYRSAASLFRHFVKALEPGDRFPDVRIVRLNSEKADWHDYQAARRHFPNAAVMSSMGATEAGNVAYFVLPAHAANTAGSLPVGRPVPGVELRVIDSGGNRCAPGVVGRVEIVGRHLAAGYWRDPELTAKVFAVEPDGRRVFRSSDMGSLDEAGLLHLAGRNDATFKIRGQRVDLSEVETALGRLPGVAAAAAAVMTRPDGALELVGYVQPTVVAPAGANRLRAIARGVMPRHLVPSAFVFLDRLPLAANGKVDRSRLAQIKPPERVRASVPVRTETETLLTSIWGEAFDLDGVGRDEDFFDLGGNSLIAAVIAARIAAARGVEFTFADFVNHPTLSGLAASLDQQGRTTGAAEGWPLVPIVRDGPIPLSPNQVPFWRDSRNPAHSRRHTRAAALRFEGPLDVDILRATLNDIVERHEILRTRFVVGDDGEPVQIVDPPAAVELPFIDYSDRADAEDRAWALLEEERQRAFDLKRTPLAMCLVKTAEQRHWLIESHHHIITDAPSWNIFLRDLAEIYEARISGETRRPPPLSVQYADFALWQRQVWRPGNRKYEEIVAWWKETFRKAGATRGLPYRRSGPAREPAAAEWTVPFALDPGTSQRLGGLAESEGATYYVMRLAAVAPVIAAVTRSDTAVVASAFTSRMHAATERMFGPFANTAIVVVACDWELSFRAFVGRVAQIVVDVQARAALPLEELRAEMAAQRVALPATHLFLHMSTAHPPLHFAGLELTWLPALVGRPPLTNLLLRFDQYREATGCHLNCDARIYDPAGMTEFCAGLARFIDAAARDPDATLGQLVEATGLAAKCGERNGARDVQASQAPRAG